MSAILTSTIDAISPIQQSEPEIDAELEGEAEEGEAEEGEAEDEDEAEEGDEDGAEEGDEEDAETETGAEATHNARTTPPTLSGSTMPPIKRDKNAIARRRREVRAARDKLSEQFEQLRCVLPEPPAGVELTAKAHILEHSVTMIEQLMQRATFLTVELAVASPDAMRRWVRACSQGGQKPLLQTVASVMKLFAVRKDWRYAEWWTLNERNHNDILDPTSVAPDTRLCDVDVNVDGVPAATPATPGGALGARNMAGVMDNPGNIHGCVVRDSESVMRLSWTLVHKGAHGVATCGTGGGDAGTDAVSFEQDEEEKIAQFARASQRYEFRPRMGMPGRVWTSRRAEWLVDLHDCEVFRRSRLVDEFGMETCLAVPIQFGGHVHSVMAFYSRARRPYDPDSYDLACALSRSLEEVYSPVRTGPWISCSDNLFPPRCG